MPTSKKLTSLALLLLIKLSTIWPQPPFSALFPSIYQFVLYIPAKWACSLFCTNLALSYFTLGSSRFYLLKLYYLPITFQVWLITTTLLEAYLDYLTIKGSLSGLVYFISIFGHFLNKSYSFLHNLQRTSTTVCNITEKIKENNMFCKNTFGNIAFYL